MTHDETCTFKKRLCRDCQLQAEARASERERIAFNISTMKAYKVQDKVVVEWGEILNLVKA